MMEAHIFARRLLGRENYFNDRLPEKWEAARSRERLGFAV
jgi:hypothetical protein